MQVSFRGVVVQVPDPTPTEPKRQKTILQVPELDLSEPRITVIGPNGSGKSTLVRLINGLVQPSSGSVLVDGVDTRRGARQIRARVGFAFTDPDAQILLPTPAEDVALSLRSRFPRDADRAAAALDILAQYGLADLAHAPAHQLSGGQKQLLALASVLAAEPDLIICDEPTTLLDLRWKAVIDNLLAGLDQQIITVTHDLAAAARCARTILVAEGLVVADGPGAEVVAQYRELAAASV